MNDAIKFYVDRLDILADEKHGIGLQEKELYESAKDAGHDAVAIRLTLKLHRLDKAKRDKLIETQNRADQYAMDLGLI